YDCGARKHDRESPGRRQSHSRSWSNLDAGRRAPLHRDAQADARGGGERREGRQEPGATPTGEGARTVGAILRLVRVDRQVYRDAVQRADWQEERRGDVCEAQLSVGGEGAYPLLTPHPPRTLATSPARGEVFRRHPPRTLAASP